MGGRSGVSPAAGTPGVDQQLLLPLDDQGQGRDPLPHRLAFPVATDGGRPFDDEARFFEPWWPGAQAFLRRSGDSIEIHTQLLGEPMLAFPELRESVRSLRADGLIVEGTLLALDAEGRPDRRLLRRALGDAGAGTGAAEGAFVACDLPWLEGASLARLPFVERRRRLSGVLRDTDHCVLGRGLVGEGLTLARAVGQLGLGSISARRLDGRWRAGPAGDAWLRMKMSPVPSTAASPFLVLLERLPLDA